MANYSFFKPVYLLHERGGARRKVMGDMKNISASEFFAADKAGGIKPKFCIRIREFEFHAEKLCEVDSILYSIYRFYSTDDGVVELYLSPRAGNNAI